MRAIGAPKTASEWMARLRADDCTAGEREAFERWRSASAANRAAFARYERLVALPRELAANADMFADLVAETDALPPLVQPTASRLARYAIAAGLACLAAAGAWHFESLLRPAPEFRTGVEQQVLALPDGSAVTLGARSRLSTAFRTDERRVTLSAGEAFFAVARDPSRPFVVSTGKSEIRVTGTQFSVRSNADLVEVVVREGKVEVVPDASRPPIGDAKPVAVALAAGKRLQFELRPGRLEVASVDAERLTAWRHGSVEFDDSTLDEVLSEMNRHFGVPLVLDDGSLGSQRISGRFRVGDSDSLAASLKERFGLRVSRQREAIHLGR